MKRPFSHILFLTIALIAISLLFATQTRATPTAGCPDISTLPCGDVKLLPDKTFTFDGSEGGLLDQNGVGMGFTMVDPPSNPGNPVPNTDAPGYWPEQLEVISNTLVISATTGLNYQAINRLDNALGIGLDLGQPATINTTLVDIPPAPGGFAQAGLWFGESSIGPSGLGGTGTTENNYIKLVVVSDAVGIWNVQALMEENGVANSGKTSVIDATEPVHLWLELNPSLRTVSARYCVGAACDVDSAVTLLTFNSVPSSWFSTDQAGIDFSVGTRSMGGIMASRRNSPTLIKFTFDEFTYTNGVSVLPISSNDGIDFASWSFTTDTLTSNPFAKPTAMDWGPDGRLYVADVTGVIHVYELDMVAHTVLTEQQITIRQNRLMLGLTVDSESTVDQIIIWVSHSDLDQFDGDANSGTVTKIVLGPPPTYAVVSAEDVITGLPRAIANHGTNNIEFGPDGRLYIAQGGNTGAGAANNSLTSEFGSRPEQPLSAAILVADVKGVDFDGSCTSLIDPDGSIMDVTGIAAKDVPCDVAVYASGLRNVYDIAFHSNGRLYGPDNGLGVVGTIPDLAPTDLTWDPASGCEGMITDIQSHFPKERPDLLYAIEEGNYYGHPNPSREQCIFFGGNPTGDMVNKNDFPIPPADPAEGVAYMDTIRYEVGRQPAPEWKQSLLHFGLNKSANGIIEYNSNKGAFCGRMDGELLVNYFSQADQVRRVELSNNGLSFLSSQTMIRSTPQTGGESLSNPLPIVQDSQGRIVVGEFGTNDITIFEPINVGLWTTTGFADMPVALLDAGSSVISDTLYAVAGKTSGGPQRTLYSYSLVDNIWTQLADLPVAYPAVENPAVAAYNGKLYVFGGATSAFSGAVNKTAVYDPTTNVWTELAAMTTARGGATAQTIGNLIYVAGGMNAAGESLATLEIYNPATNTWSSGPDLALARDNASSAAIGGKMYIFGGRLRNGGGEVDPTLNSVEIYDPNTGWSAGAPMPTGRRTTTTVVYEGRAIVMGGEKTTDGGTFVATEAYDPVSDSWQLLTNMPVGRHGAIAGLLDNIIIVGGGGTVGGTDFTSDLDGFFFDCAADTSNPDSLVYLPIVMKP